MTLALSMIGGLPFGQSADAQQSATTSKRGSKVMSKPYATGWDPLLALTGHDQCGQRLRTAMCDVQNASKHVWLTDVAISDGHGHPIYAIVYANSRPLGGLCGEIDRLFRLTAGKTVDVHIWWDPLFIAFAQCSAVPGSTGTIEMTFSRKAPPA